MAPPSWKRHAREFPGSTVFDERSPTGRTAVLCVVWLGVGPILVDPSIRARHPKGEVCAHACAEEGGGRDRVGASLSSGRRAATGGGGGRCLPPPGRRIRARDPPGGIVAPCPGSHLLRASLRTGPSSATLPSRAGRRVLRRTRPTPRLFLFGLCPSTLALRRSLILRPFSPDIFRVVSLTPTFHPPSSILSDFIQITQDARRSPAPLPRARGQNPQAQAPRPEPE